MVIRVTRVRRTISLMNDIKDNRGECDKSYDVRKLIAVINAARLIKIKIGSA